MKAATILPTRKIVPGGEGSLVQPLRGYDGVFACILWFSGTAWMRMLIRDTSPSHDDCLDDLRTSPGLWVCIANNN